MALADRAKRIQLNLFFSDCFRADMEFNTHQEKPSLNLIRSGCAVCSNLTSKCCNNCKKIMYCSKECQEKDWSQHKEFCDSLSKQLGNLDDPWKDPLHLWTSKNAKLFEMGMASFRKKNDRSLFLAFMIDDFRIASEEDLRKIVVPPSTLKSDFWKMTFKMHRARGKDDISLLIPYSNGKGFYHFMIREMRDEG